MKIISACDLVKGNRFKTTLRQKKMRVVSAIFKHNDGDCDTLRGCVLICFPDCSQLVLLEKREVFLFD